MTSKGTLNLRHSSFAEDFTPIEKGCGCVCCRPIDQGGLGITRAYIYHVTAKETAGAHLYGVLVKSSQGIFTDRSHSLTMHNVHYQLALMRSIRAAVVEDRYPNFLRNFFKTLYPDDKGKIPKWAVTALRGVGVDLLAD